jgi:hypothetical protein
LRKSVSCAAVLFAALAFLAACAAPSGNAANPGTPGATGATIVPGSTSTLAGDSGATAQQQKSPVSERR